MTWQTVVSSIGIIVGAAVMVISIIRFGRVFKAAHFLPAPDRLSLLRFLRVHRVLMIFFLIGYAAVVDGMILGVEFLNELFVAATFFLGASFVYIGIVLQERLVHGVMDEAKESLRIHKLMTDAAKDALILVGYDGVIEYSNRVQPDSSQL